jgi:protein tyrosine phosphatase (PTP) superfamily phosphohydrolase (DUF442 family)
MWRDRLGLVLTALLVVGGYGLSVARGEKRLHAVEPGRVYRGAWQDPATLRRLVRREGIRTIVTLTAINRDDPKYVAQSGVVKELGLEWIIIPMRGSTATLEEMREAAELVGDRRRQPVLFHCVGGHHRSNLVQAAYRMVHEGWSGAAAWGEVARLPWTRPERDGADRRQIEAFSRMLAGGEMMSERGVASGGGSSVRGDGERAESPRRTAERDGACR